MPIPHWFNVEEQRLKEEEERRKKEEEEARQKEEEAQKLKEEEQARFVDERAQYNTLRETQTHEIKEWKRTEKESKEVSNHKHIVVTLYSHL